jgi:hypothetical protein
MLVILYVKDFNLIQKMDNIQFKLFFIIRLPHQIQFMKHASMQDYMVQVLNVLKNLFLLVQQFLKKNLTSYNNFWMIKIML